MKITKIMILGTLISLKLHGLAGEIQGEMFEQGSNKGKKIFNYKNKFTDETSLTEITDLSGQIAVIESAQLKGAELVRFEIQQKQIGAKGIIEVKGDEVFFTKEVDGKVKTEKEKKADTLIVPNNFGRFIKAKWSDLMAGKEFDIRFGVWDRMETVGFTIVKVGEETIDGAKTYKIRMKPTSFIIAAIVKPLFMNYSEDGSKIVSLNGRVAPKQKNGSSWADLDAEVYYHYQ